MSLFDSENPVEKKPKKIKPFYRVYTMTEDEAVDHEPDCLVEAVAVGNEAHYVVKKADGTIDGMYPFSNVEYVIRVTEEEEE
jgi:hypothetical protein